MVCFEYALFVEYAIFVKMSDGQLVPLPWIQKNINILSFFIHGICESGMGYLDTICVVHIQLCYKKVFRFENGQFLVF